MKKVLIIQTAFLGDVILATPLAETLAVNFPGIEIHYLVKKGNEGLIEHHDFIQTVHVFDKKGGKVKALKSLIPQLRKERFDLAVNLHRFGSSGIITALCGAKKTVGFKKNPFSFLYNIRAEHEIGNGQHEVDRNLSLLSFLQLKETFRRPKLFPTEAHRSKVHSYKNETYFCMAPASVWMTKQLPFDKWSELIALKLQKGKVYLLGGPDDHKLCEDLKMKSGTEEVINLAGKLSLLESLALMEDASRNYVNDSGPMHLASAVNAPVTAFFCSTTPAFGFGPLSDDHQVVQNEEELTCKPCGLHGHRACPEGHFKCGHGISIPAVK